MIFLVFSGYYTFKKVVSKINLSIVIIFVNSIINFARYECKYKNNNHSLLRFEERPILPISRAPNLANTSLSKRLFFGAFHIIRPISALACCVEKEACGKEQSSSSTRQDVLIVLVQVLKGWGRLCRLVDIVVKARQ